MLQLQIPTLNNLYKDLKDAAKQGDLNKVKKAVALISIYYRSPRSLEGKTQEFRSQMFNRDRTEVTEAFHLAIEHFHYELAIFISTKVTTLDNLEGTPERTINALNNALIQGKFEMVKFLYLSFYKRLSPFIKQYGLVMSIFYQKNEIALWFFKGLESIPPTAANIIIHEAFETCIRVSNIEMLNHILFLDETKKIISLESKIKQLENVFKYKNAIATFCLLYFIGKNDTDDLFTCIEKLNTYSGYSTFFLSYKIYEMLLFQWSVRLKKNQETLLTMRTGNENLLAEQKIKIENNTITKSVDKIKSFFFLERLSSLNLTKKNYHPHFDIIQADKKQKLESNLTRENNVAQQGFVPWVRKTPSSPNLTNKNYHPHFDIIQADKKQKLESNQTRQNNVVNQGFVSWVRKTTPSQVQAHLVQRQSLSEISSKQKHRKRKIVGLV